MVVKKQLERGGRDMTNKIIFKLVIEKDNVLIKINEKKEKSLSIKNKTINTSDIYKMLKYNKNNLYSLDCKKIPDEEITGKDQEIKRLYNYLYDLLSQIIDAVNDENKLLQQKSLVH